MKKIISIASMVFVLTMMLTFTANAADTVMCSSGQTFSMTTGERCTHFTDPVVCPQGQTFSAVTGARCTSFTNPVFCPLGQMFSLTTGERCTVFNPNSSVTSNYNFGTNTVRQGNVVSEECMVWQIFFNNKRNTNLVVDGKCGPLTMSVTRAWQASVGLSADGILGPMSRTMASAQ